MAPAIDLLKQYGWIEFYGKPSHVIQPHMEISPEVFVLMRITLAVCWTCCVVWSLHSWNENGHPMGLWLIKKAGWVGTMELLYLWMAAFSTYLAASSKPGRAMPCCATLASTLNKYIPNFSFILIPFFWIYIWPAMPHDKDDLEIAGGKVSLSGNPWEIGQAFAMNGVGWLLCVVDMIIAQQTVPWSSWCSCLLILLISNITELVYFDVMKWPNEHGEGGNDKGWGKSNDAMESIFQMIIGTAAACLSYCLCSCMVGATCCLPRKLKNDGDSDDDDNDSDKSDVELSKK